MGVEVMIYLYGAVCVSMIGFNVIYTIVLRGSQPRMQRRARRLQWGVQRQMARLERGEKVEERYLRRLERKLRRVKNLIAFDRVLRPLTQKEADPWVQAFLTQIQPCILYLALAYQKRENMQAAYFSYFLSRYMLHKQMPIQTLQEVLLEYMAKDNLYCQVNALQALCAFGSADHILDALARQDGGKVFLHEKILTEALLSFTGDHEQLIALLWARLDTFTPHTQLGILNYIRFRTGAYTREMFELMQDPSRDKEVRLAAIRYFGRYPYPPALDPLLAFARDQDPLQWEYATVSVSALARYQGPLVIEALKEALHSANWYVRYAAAAGLEAQGASYEDLLDIVSGSDRYAREMMTYRLESRRIQKAGV